MHGSNTTAAGGSADRQRPELQRTTAASVCLVSGDALMGTNDTPQAKSRGGSGRGRDLLIRQGLVRHEVDQQVIGHFGSCHGPRTEEAPDDPIKIPLCLPVPAVCGIGDGAHPGVPGVPGHGREDDLVSGVERRVRGTRGLHARKIVGQDHLAEHVYRQLQHLRMHIYGLVGAALGCDMAWQGRALPRGGPSAHDK